MTTDQYGVYQDTDGTYYLEDGTALVEYNADNGKYVEESDPTTLYNADGSVADDNYAADDTVSSSSGGGGFWSGTNFNTIFGGIVQLASGYMAMKSGKTMVKSQSQSTLQNVKPLVKPVKKPLSTLAIIGIVVGTGLLITTIVIIANKKSK